MSTLWIAISAAALYYLGNRAKITRWLWIRYPTPLATFMDCSACTGFWYGALLAATVGRWEGWTYLGLDLDHASSWPLVGLASIVVTPIIAGAMQRGIDSVGVVAVDLPPPPEAK